MNLSIVIVNYNTYDHVQECLRSIYRYYEKELPEIIVVDNDSSDKRISALVQSFPGVKFIQAGYNSGFSHANNLGIRAASHALLLLLNPDTEFIDDSLKNCYRVLTENREIAACGCGLLNPDRTEQVSGGYNSDVFWYVLAIPLLGKLLRPLIHRDHPRPTKEMKSVEWIMGAFLMVKKDAIDKAGLLDESFFMYAEEIEWCNRIAKYGRLVVINDTHVLHHVGGSSASYYEAPTFKLSDRRERQRILSILLLVKKIYGPGKFLFTLLAFVVGMPFYLMYPLYKALRGEFKQVAPVFRESFLYCSNVAAWCLQAPAILFNIKKQYKA